MKRIVLRVAYLLSGAICIACGMFWLRTHFSRDSAFYYDEYVDPPPLAPLTIDDADGIPVVVSRPDSPYSNNPLYADRDTNGVSLESSEGALSLTRFRWRMRTVGITTNLPFPDPALIKLDRPKYGIDSEPAGYDAPPSSFSGPVFPPEPIAESKTLFRVHYWFIMIICAVPILFRSFVFARWYTKQIIARRRRPGFCDHCGYDLRATPNRCPECGMSRQSDS